MRIQQECVKEKDAVALTVALPALLLLCPQDVVGQREVLATSDIQGAFLRTKQPEEDKVIILFQGPMMVDALARIGPTVCWDKTQFAQNGDELLCSKARKAIHRTVQAAHLFWKNLLV